MNDQISWHVELQVKPDQLDAFRALTSEMVESTRSELGTLIYERFISDDNQFVHAFERYVDSAAAVMHLIAFGKTYGERFAKMVDRKRFTVFGTSQTSDASRAHSTTSAGQQPIERLEASEVPPCPSTRPIAP